MKYIGLLIAAIAIAMASVVCAARVFGHAATGGQGDAGRGGEQWEYLVVSGGTVNLTPSGNPNLRKAPDMGFIRETFPLEQNMDKLGAKGWELVSISGGADPTFYFKRKK